MLCKAFLVHVDQYQFCWNVAYARRAPKIYWLHIYSRFLRVFGLWRPAQILTKVWYLMQLIDQLIGGRPPFVAVKAKIASRDAKSNKWLDGV